LSLSCCKSKKSIKTKTDDIIVITSLRVSLNEIHDGISHQRCIGQCLQSLFITFCVFRHFQRFRPPSLRLDATINPSFNAPLPSWQQHTDVTYERSWHYLSVSPARLLLLLLPRGMMLAGCGDVMHWYDEAWPVSESPACSDQERSYIMISGRRVSVAPRLIRRLGSHALPSVPSPVVLTSSLSTAVQLSWHVSEALRLLRSGVMVATQRLMGRYTRIESNLVFRTTRPIAHSKPKLTN